MSGRGSALRGVADGRGCGASVRGRERVAALGAFLGFKLDFPSSEVARRFLGTDRPLSCSDAGP